MASPTAKPQPSPELIFETLNAYQRTAALRAAIALDIFTRIGEGTDTCGELAKRCEATERGVRILCDYLVVHRFLTKQDGRYGLTDDSAMFLDRRSPACIASAAGFLTLPVTINAYHDLARTIRTGQPAMSEGEGSISAENPIWVEFARSMAPMVTPSAEEVARVLDASEGRKWKVLDLAGGHGMFGITLAKHNPNAEIFAQDWGSVLAVATENARAAGVDARHHPIPGSAFEVDFGADYDVVLITNFLHHFDAATNESLLRKVRASLAPGGVVATLDFVPNEDRVSPPRAASFSMMMLGMTPAGDAYTFSEYEQMFRNAGFSSNELRPLGPIGHSVILSRA
jgi:2-polyprenyl-3-methyl-5-hydroxy-6-metoxy-1,4-benzoquinol methylase